MVKRQLEESGEAENLLAGVTKEWMQFETVKKEVAMHH